MGHNRQEEKVRQVLLSNCIDVQCTCTATSNQKAPAFCLLGVTEEDAHGSINSNWRSGGAIGDLEAGARRDRGGRRPAAWELGSAIGSRELRCISFNRSIDFSFEW